MGMPYLVGLGLITAVVFIWVASAETTQRIFKEYQHPFVLSYLGVSLMAVYLPVVLLKYLIRRLCTGSSTTGSFLFHGAPVKLPITETSVDEDLRLCLVEKTEFGEKILDLPLNEAKGDAEGDGCLSLWDISKCGFYLSPIWFITEYFSNSALANTSVASTTVLTSTSGLFTLFFGVLIGEETVNAPKVIAVVISMTGVALTTVGKTWAADELLSITESRSHSLLGDFFGLFSAMLYGLFTVLLKRSVGTGDRLCDVEKLFGIIGLFTFVGLWWLGIPLCALGLEPRFELPRSKSLAELVLLNGFIGSFVSDYLWALSVVWTTPLVAVLGLSMSIPLAMCADMVIHGRNYSPIYVVGCIQVFLGFVVANLSDKFTSMGNSWRRVKLHFSFL